MAPLRRPPRRPLQGDALAHQADRRLRPLPRWRLVVLHPHRRGPAVRHPLPQPRLPTPPTTHPSKSSSMATSSPKATPSLPSAQPTSPTTAAGWPTPPTPPASASTPCTSRISKPAKHSPAKSSASAPSSGPPTITPSSTPSKTRSRSASSSFGAASSALQHTADVLVYQDDDERFNLGRRPHPRRQIHRTRIGQPHHQRIPCAARRRTRRRIHPHRTPPGRARILHRPPQRPLVHPHQRPWPQLSPRHRSRRHAWPRTLDRAHSPSRRHHARRRRSLRQTSSSPASAKTACPACASGASRAIGPPSRAGRRNRLSLSQPTAPIPTSTASSTAPPSATPINPWSRPARSTSTTSPPALPRFSSRRRFPAASTAPSTPASVSTPPRPTASRSPSRSSTAKTSASRQQRKPSAV